MGTPAAAAARFPRAALGSLLPLLLLLVTAAAQVPSDADELPGCRRGKYLDPVSGKCRSCTHDIDFMDEDYNRQPRCHACSPCSSMKVEVAPCTTSKDTVCRCREGYHENVDGMCSLGDLPEATTTARSAGAAVTTLTTAPTTKSAGRRGKDVPPDSRRQVEYQRDLLPNCQDGTGRRWEPIVLTSLMVIILVIVSFVLAIVVTMRRSQRETNGSNGHSSSLQVKEDGPALPPPVTDLGASRGSVAPMSTVAHAEKNTPPPPLTVKTSGRTMAEHHRPYDPDSDSNELQVFIPQGEHASGQVLQDQTQGRKLVKRSLSRTASSSSASPSYQ